MVFVRAKAAVKTPLLQTLHAGWGVWQSRQRLECGGFSTAVVQTKVFI